MRYGEFTYELFSIIMEVNTLEDVLYLSMKNDVSFLVGGTMNLYEHQSTFNPNMPLRGVFYFSRLYEGYVADNNLMIYHEKRVRLPKPKYIVFYNGTKNQPDSMELRLSDCFENTDNGAPCLECTATHVEHQLWSQSGADEALQKT